MSDTDDRHLGTEGASDTAAPMRLRGDPPRVTRLSRKALAGIGLVASIGLGGALIYALQTRNAGPRNEELYSTTTRPTVSPDCRATIPARGLDRRCRATWAAPS